MYNFRNFARFYPNADFLDGFPWKSPTKNFTAIRLLEAALIHADGRKVWRTGGHDEANGRTFKTTRTRLKHHKLPAPCSYLCASPECEKMFEHLET